jgi:hypothetical protein
VNRPRRCLLALGLLVAIALTAGACEDDPRDQLAGAGTRARCMADGARATFGGDTVDAMQEAGRDLGELGGLASDKGDELRRALDGCIDVEQTLTDALVDAGLSETKAACVADRALHDDEILGPLLVAMVFGDPGITTAVAIAVRAGGPCLTAEDVDRVLPG